MKIPFVNKGEHNDKESEGVDRKKGKINTKENDSSKKKKQNDKESEGTNKKKRKRYTKENESGKKKKQNDLLHRQSLLHRYMDIIGNLIKLFKKLLHIFAAGKRKNENNKL